MDSGEDEHVVTRADCQGEEEREALLQPAQVRLRSATCDDMEVLGGIVLRGKCSQQAVEITALVADQATKSLCSAAKLSTAKCDIDLRQTQSVLFHKRGGRIPLQRCGRQDNLEKRMTEGPREINAMTLSSVKREVESLKIEMRALCTSHFTATVPRAPWSPEEKRRHEMNGHAEYDDRCEICVKTRGISR